MIVAGDSGTREGRKLHFKKEFGKSMFLKNKHYENWGRKMEKIGEHSKIILNNTRPQRKHTNQGKYTS